jgi:membrane protein
MLHKIFSFNYAGWQALLQSHMPDLFRFAARRLDEERLPQVASSLTFTTVLALVPLLTIALAIFTAFPLFNTFRTSLEAYFLQNLMPKVIANTILSYLNQFASKSTKLSAVGGVALFITAVSTMMTIEHVFNRIWQVRTKRPLTQRIFVYWTIVTLGPLLIGVSITLTSYLFTATNGIIKDIPFIGTVLYTITSLLLTTAAFTLLYVAVPNRFVDWRDAAWGGLLAGSAFEMAKRLFAIYITQFPTYTIVYGAIAAVPIFLVWIYMFWMITLVGALFSAALPIVKYERWWHTATPGSAFVDAMAILWILYDARTTAASTIVDAALIRTKTRLGFDESEALLQKMLEAGWVGRIKPESPRRIQLAKRFTEGMDCWVLLSNPAHLRIADVYRLFAFNPAGNEALARQVENVIEQQLDQSLSAHFNKSQLD